MENQSAALIGGCWAAHGIVTTLRIDVEDTTSELSLVRAAQVVDDLIESLVNVVEPSVHVSFYPLKPSVHPLKPSIHPVEPSVHPLKPFGHPSVHESYGLHCH